MTQNKPLIVQNRTELERQVIRVKAKTMSLTTPLHPAMLFSPNLISSDNSFFLRSYRLDCLSNTIVLMNPEPDRAFQSMTFGIRLYNPHDCSFVRPRCFIGQEQANELVITNENSETFPSCFTVPFDTSKLRLDNVFPIIPILANVYCSVKIKSTDSSYFLYDDHFFIDRSSKVDGNLTIANIMNMV